MNSSTRPTPRPFRDSDAQAILPRSASLALWLPRVASGQWSPEVAAQSVQQEDEPHIIDDRGSAVSLVTFLRSTLGRVVASCAVFPVPGDIASAPYLATHSGVESEELVLVRMVAEDRSQRNIALVPEVTEFGPAGDRGYSTHWNVVEVDPWEFQVLGSAGSLADAQRALRVGLAQATEALIALDVARWHEEHADLIDLLRDSYDLSGYIPEDLPARVYSILESSARLRAIVDIARFSDGSALNSTQAQARLRLLRDVDAISRRAMEAATLMTPLVG